MSMKLTTTPTPLTQLLLDRLDDDDDPALWVAALDHVLAELEKKPGTVVEIGRCSHWLRPHQTRWTADGGFAWPSGYGGLGYSRLGLPLFDWSVVVQWSGEKWVAPSQRPRAIGLRITIPSRTTRHQQAAIHTLWTTGRIKEMRLYGFRKKDGEWKCTAESEWAEDRENRGRYKNHNS